MRLFMATLVVVEWGGASREGVDGRVACTCTADKVDRSKVIHKIERCLNKVEFEEYGKEHALASMTDLRLPFRKF
ncbi:hypothetical protein E2C01_043198 [Portunus trituberculatus]|uniref:Uncharacterized protein n=1 Tax=Portunus trituberculatus TaxID=210409 RepID=A0A5B7FVN5_PORTR|nr:hypothetical protein [Portunus trituberculatus]